MIWNKLLSAVCLIGIVTAFIITLFTNVGHEFEPAKMKPEDATNYYNRVIPEFVDLVFVAYILLISFIGKVMLQSCGVSTPFAALIGMIGYMWGIIAARNDVVRLASSIMDVQMQEVAYVYIPILIFQLTFSLDIHIFLKTFPQIAVIGSCVSLSTATIFGIIASKLINPEWPFKNGLLFGVFCMSTLPRDILYLLKQQSTRTKRIGVLLEGEAIVSFLMTTLTFTLLITKHLESVQWWYQYIFIILRICIGGFLCGWLFAQCCRFLIRQMYDERHSVLMVFCIFPFLVFSISNLYVSGCGSSSVLVFGIMMSMERAVLDRQTEKFLMLFWEMMSFIADMFICMIVAIKYAVVITRSRNWKDYAVTIAIFVLYYVIRFSCFLLFSPILSRIGYGMDLKSMLVCVWGGLKSPFVLLAACLLLQIKTVADVAQESFFHITGIYFFSILINGTFIDKIMDFLDLKLVSLARKININKCMKHILQKREKTIAILRMDRFLSDSNWDIVTEATTMKHPYQMDLETDEEDDDDYLFKSYKFTYCADCKKEIPEDPTPKELKEMTRQARLRVLKTKKMSYSRQYENGMITEEGIQILSQAVELGMDSPTYTIRVEDLEEQFTQENRFKRFVRRRAEKLAKKRKTKFRPPDTYWRRVFYHVVLTHRTFAKVMLGLVTVDLIILGLDFHSHPYLFSDRYPNHGFWVDRSLLVYKILFVAIYLIEMVLIVMAYSRKYICEHGFRTYFRNFWHILDFMANIGYVLSAGATLFDIARQEHVNIDDSFRRAIDVLRILKVFRFFRIFDIFYPDIINYLDKSVDAKMAFTYELGKSYVTGETEVLDMLPYMIDNKAILEETRQKIEADRLLITKSLGIVQKERPWIAITVKTKQAIRTILNGMKESITSLKTAGWIDEYENEKLMKEMNMLFKKVSSIRKVDPSPPKVVFKEVPWMEEDEHIIDFLFENVQVKNFEPGQVVFAEGDVADGIYIVVTGLFLLTYTPNKEVIENLEEYGRLPIVDYLSGTKYQEPYVDYIVSGNCIGELSTLTERSYNCVITADAHSQVYVLTRGVLNRAMELSPDPFTGLESRIWKEVSIRIALPLLLQIPAYQAFSQDQIKYALERAFVPNLSRYKIFAVTEVIENIILIEGVVLDFNKRRLYTAPCCIPRTVQKLILPISSLIYFPVEISTRLLLIPEKDVDEYDVMQVAEETCEMVGTMSSSRCLQHVVQTRMRNRKRRKMRGASSSARRRLADEVSMGPSMAASMGTSMGTVPSRFEEVASGLYFRTTMQEIGSVYMPPEEETEMQTYERQFVDENASIFETMEQVTEPRSVDEEEDMAVKSDGEPPGRRHRKRQSVFFL